MNLASSIEMRISLSCFLQPVKPAVAPWRLALVTVFQFMEGLSDRQAADAVRSRLDWKYALGLAFGRFRLRLLGPVRVPQAASLTTKQNKSYSIKLFRAV